MNSDSCATNLVVMRTMISELRMEPKLLVAPTFFHMRHIMNATKYSLPDLGLNLLLKTAHFFPGGAL